MNNGKVSKIITNDNGENIVQEFSFDFTNELKTEIDNNWQVMLELYDSNSSNNIEYEVKINIDGIEKTFYNCFDLYIDLSLMLKSNKLNHLSINSLISERKRQKQQQTDEQNKKDWEKEMLDKEIQFERDSAKLPNNFIDQDYDVLKFEFERKKINEISINDSYFIPDYSSTNITKHFDVPNYYSFFGQVNLINIPKNNYNLPQGGMLYFLLSDPDGYGKVIYDENLNTGISSNYNGEDYCYVVSNIIKSTENIKNRYKEGEYNYFAGSEITKVGGILVNCQYDEELIKKISSNFVLLFQIGSEILGWGTISFLIKEEDLLNKNFNNVITNVSSS